jgi:GR25 family glycosyltransferase involved in LPS biosynthesis
MHVDNRAKDNIEVNKELLKDYTYVSDIEFFNGNKGNSWDIINHLGIRQDVWNPYDGRVSSPLPGELGVWVSTINTWKYIVNNNINYFLLLEDDVILNKNFVENLNKVFLDLPENFDFLSLYYFEGHNWEDENTDIGSEYIHKSNNQYSAGQVTLYSLSGAKKLLKLIKRKGIEYTSDCFVFKQAHIGSVSGYSIKPDKLVFAYHDDVKISSLIDPENTRNTRIEINEYLKNIPYYYINLKKDILRRKNIENHFNVNKIKKYIRIDAVDKESCDKHPALSPAETACSLSHIKAVKTFLESSKDDFAVICEDDVDISNININKIDIQSFLDIENDLCIQLSVSVDNKVTINFNPHEKQFVDYGTMAYLVNRKYAQKIVDTFGEDPSFSNFTSEEKIHPSGEKIMTIPVSDELVYSLCKTITFPVFSFFNYESNIASSVERTNAIVKSIREFDDYWYRK